MSRWYKRYPGDFIDGTIGLSLEEKGAYSLLLDLIYMREGPIPDDERWLAGVCGVSVRKWKAIRKRLIDAGKIAVTGGRLTNFRATFELENAAKTHRKLAESGAKGGRQRVENERERNKNNDLGQARLKLARAKNRTEKKEKDPPIGGSKKKGCRFENSEWSGTVPDDWRAWAVEMGLENVDGVADSFADYWRSTPGQRGVKLDWQATWRNWCRREAERQIRQPKSSHDRAREFRAGVFEWLKEQEHEHAESADGGNGGGEVVSLIPDARRYGGG